MPFARLDRILSRRRIGSFLGILVLLPCFVLAQSPAGGGFSPYERAVLEILFARRGTNMIDGAWVIPATIPAGSLVPGSIATADIADNAITASKLAPGVIGDYVTEAELVASNYLVTSTYTIGTNDLRIAIIDNIAASNYVTSAVLAGSNYVTMATYTNGTNTLFLAVTNWVHDQAYLTAETDPVFAASVAYAITSGLTNQWSTAYGWGNHAGLYPLLATWQNTNLSFQAQIDVFSTGKVDRTEWAGTNTVFEGRIYSLETGKVSVVDYAAGTNAVRESILTQIDGSNYVTAATLAATSTADRAYADGVVAAAFGTNVLFSWGSTWPQPTNDAPWNIIWSPVAERPYNVKYIELLSEGGTMVCDLITAFKTNAIRSYTTAWTNLSMSTTWATQSLDVVVAAGYRIGIICTNMTGVGSNGWFDVGCAMQAYADVLFSWGSTWPQPTNLPPWNIIWSPVAQRAYTAKYVELLSEGGTMVCDVITANKTNAIRSYTTAWTNLSMSTTFATQSLNVAVAAGTRIGLVCTNMTGEGSNGWFNVGCAMP